MIDNDNISDCDYYKYCSFLITLFIDKIDKLLEGYDVQ